MYLSKGNKNIKDKKYSMANKGDLEVVPLNALCGEAWQGFHKCLNLAIRGRNSGTPGPP
jgi:hypothetical protein